MMIIVRIIFYIILIALYTDVVVAQCNVNDYVRPKVHIIDNADCDPCNNKSKGEFDDCFVDHADDVPITTDTRIRTNIYNPNEVYLIILHYGFQSNIEFASGEEAETISLGDTYGWQITSLGRRLIIRPLEKNIRTNMTIITNKRTYQFDLVSKDAAKGYEKELVYVTKFYYPKKRCK